MTLGIALLLIFVLYLIDKHNRWRQALKLTVGLVVLGIIVIAGFFGWQKYQTYREEKQEEAEVAAQQARVSACVSRLEQIPVPKDAAVADVPGEVQTACDGNPDATRYVYISASRPLWQPVDATPKPAPRLKKQGQYSAANVEQPPPNCGVVVCSGWAVVTSDYGSRIESRNCFDTDLNSRISCGNIAVLKKGDRVQILSDKVRTPDGSDIYGAKFQQWTGWVNARDISVDPSVQ